jgi:hypothetical protein
MNNIYEKSGLSNRIKESGSILLFIFIALIASLIVMNILILPIALFSINHKAIFTTIVKGLLAIIVIASIGWVLVKKIIFYRKNELPNYQIIKNIILRPLSFLLFLFLLLVIILILVILINFLLQKNYYLLYSIINL